MYYLVEPTVRIGVSARDTLPPTPVDVGNFNRLSIDREREARGVRWPSCLLADAAPGRAGGAGGGPCERGCVAVDAAA